MDELFFKSALPAQDTFLLDDTSLALPSEPSARSSTKHVSSDRSLRVHQQVQLTLARKARRSVSNGSLSLQKHTAKSFDAADGLLPNTKMNGWALTSHSEASSRLQKPSRRVEVSPPPSPQLPRSRFNYSAYRFGTVTLPIQSHRVSPPLGHSFGFDSFRRYAFSEVPRLTRPHASTSAHGSFRQRSLRQAAGQQPMFAQAAFHGGGEYDSGWSHNQTVVKQQIPTLQAAFQGGGEYDSGWSHNQTILKQEIPNVQAAFQGGGEYDSGWSHNQAVLKQEIPTIQAAGGDMILGVTQPEEEISWLTQMRREGLELQRHNSYPPSVISMEVDMGKQMEADSPIQQMQAQKVTTLKSENTPPEMTLERAVNLLTQDNEEMLICAASHIQNQCFKSADAKKMVYYLRGIGKLLQLLQSDNEEVQRVVAGALRNVVYQSDENKMEVKEGGGLATVLDALKSSRDTETRRQLTGLLWNLSSHDILKERLTKEALPVLIKSVLVPSSGISEGENPKDELLADADVFHFATGCLRNLSSSGPDGRKAMRDCENLIDSLVYYVRGTIADHKTDDKSTENCVCILHNLSYQIEAELPKKYTQDLRESRQNLAPKQKSVSCFPDRSAKITEQLQRQSPLLEDKANPRGIEWLWSSITIRMYMSLIARSVRHYTQEAAIGALQNITAGNGPVSEAITFTIVQRENGLQQIKKILQEGERDVKRTAMSLIENASRYQDLHPEIVNQVLPEVVEMLPNDDTGTDLPTAVTCCLCHILTNLSQSDSQHVRAIVNQGALPKIINISSKDKGCGPSRAGNAACVLLHTMWKHKDLHRAYKKCGYKKADFVNARTTKAVNSGNY